MRPRFFSALACYAVLALAAGLTLESKPRAVVWLLLGAFAVKTWIAYRRQA